MSEAMTAFGAPEEPVSVLAQYQLQHFTSIEPKCKGVELAEGILLRYRSEKPLFFFLRSFVEGEEIVTRIFSSDSAFDKEKTFVRELRTTNRERCADVVHLEQIERTLRDFVIFVADLADGEEPFMSEEHTFDL